MEVYSMQEVVDALDRIANNLQAGVPAWVTIFGAIAPIILTIVTIALSIQMNRQNKKLQKEIHNRDVLNQSRKDVLAVYNAYCNSLLTLQKYGPVESIFASDYGTMKWNEEILASHIEVINACNTANLLFEDRPLTDCLISLRDQFSAISADVSRYLFSGQHNTTRQEAITRVANQFGVGVDYILSPNASPSMRDRLFKECENSFTREISDKIEKYSKLIDDEAFNALFKKYIKIDAL